MYAAMRYRYLMRITALPLYAKGRAGSYRQLPRSALYFSWSIHQIDWKSNP